MYRRSMLWGVAAVLVLAAPTSGWAQDSVKIGLILPMTGQQASTGKQINAAVRLYQQEHGTTVAGKKVEVIVKDDGAVPDNTKRLAQELIVNDKVSVIAGFGVTPAALAAAPLATEAKVVEVVMAAGTSIITERSPYITRTSFTLPQSSVIIADWAGKNGIKKVVSIVSDYAPGADAEKSFSERFKAAGGEVVEAIKVIGPGDVTDDDLLPGMGDAVIGAVTAHLYSADHDSVKNKAYVEAFKKANNFRPNFMSVGGYDGMHLIYEALKKTGGKSDGDSLIAAMKGLAWESPRGPISIDPETRDIVQNIYIRKVEKKDGELYNVEFATFEAVKDYGKTKK